MVELVQLVRMPDCDSGGRRFKSRIPPHKNKKKSLIWYKPHKEHFKLTFLFFMKLKLLSFLFLMKLNLAVQWYFFEYIALNSDSDSYFQKNDIANAKVKVYIIIFKYINNFLKSTEKSFYTSIRKHKSGALCFKVFPHFLF